MSCPARLTTALKSGLNATSNHTFFEIGPHAAIFDKKPSFLPEGFLISGA